MHPPQPQQQQQQQQVRGPKFTGEGGPAPRGNNNYPPTGGPQQQQRPHHQQGQQQQPYGTSQSSRPNYNRVYLPLPRKNFKMMSKPEIANVIKWQLTQLRGSSAMEDDFYFQVWQSRQGKTARPSTQLEKFQWRTNPHQARNPDGTPKLDPTTLGKIRASSLRAPRKLMDFSADAPDEVDLEEKKGEEEEDDDDDEKKMKKEKAAAAPKARSRLFAKMWITVSCLVEQGMRCLISIEDIDSMIIALQSDPQAFTDPGRQFQIEQQRAKLADGIAKLCEALDMEESPKPSADHVVLNFAHLKKGRLFLDRSLLRLPPEKAAQLAGIMLFDAKKFAQYSSDVDAALTDDLSNLVLANMPIQRLNHIFLMLASQAKNEKERNGWEKSAKFISSMLVCSCLQSIFKKGHETAAQIQHMQADGAPPQLLKPLEDAMRDWKQILNFFYALIKDRLHSGIFAAYSGDEKEEKKGDAPKDHDDNAAADDENDDDDENGEAASRKKKKKKKKKKKPSSKKGTRKNDEDEKEGGAKSKDSELLVAPLRELWEFLAAMISHGSPEQRESFRKEVCAMLCDERLNPDTKPPPSDVGIVDTAQEPEHAQPSRGFQYLRQLFLPPPPLGSPGGSDYSPEPSR